MPTESYEHSTVIGLLTRVPHGLDEGGDAYYFETSKGNYLSVIFSGGYTDVRAVPLNTKIALCMSDVEVDGFRIICSHQPFFTEVK